MRHFRLGDYVEVAGLPGSKWQHRQGTVVEIFEHGLYEQEQIAEECAVNIGGERRCFMTEHLVKTLPPKLVRLFRAEIMERWHLDPNDVHSLKGDRHELVDLLCDRLSFTMRRAEAEVDDFYTEFDERLARAIDQNPSRPDHKPPERVPLDRKTAP